MVPRVRVIEFLFFCSRLQGYAHGIVTSGVNSPSSLVDKLLPRRSLKHNDSLYDYDMNTESTRMNVIKVLQYM